MIFQKTGLFKIKEATNAGPEIEEDSWQANCVITSSGINHHLRNCSKDVKWIQFVCEF